MPAEVALLCIKFTPFSLWKNETRPVGGATSCKWILQVNPLLVWCHKFTPFSLLEKRGHAGWSCPLLYIKFTPFSLWKNETNPVRSTLICIKFTPFSLGKNETNPVKSTLICIKFTPFSLWKNETNPVKSTSIWIKFTPFSLWKNETNPVRSTLICIKFTPFSLGKNETDPVEDALKKEEIGKVYTVFHSKKRGWISLIIIFLLFFLFVLWREPRIDIFMREMSFWDFIISVLILINRKRKYGETDRLK